MGLYLGWGETGQTSQNYQLPEPSVPWPNTPYASQDGPVDMSTIHHSPDINENAPPTTVELNWVSKASEFENTSSNYPSIKIPTTKPISDHFPLSY